MGSKTLKRGTNIDGRYYGPGEKIDEDLVDNPKLFIDPPPGHPDFDGELIDEVADPEEVAEREREAAEAAAAAAAASGSGSGDGGSKDPAKTTPAKKATTKKAAAKKAASSSS